MNCCANLTENFEWKEEKTARLIDNCPAHPSVLDLTKVQLVFLPSNATSILQPMDQSVIRSLKAHYRARVALRLCRALDKTKAKNIYSSDDENTSIFMGSCDSTNHCQLF